MDQVLKKNPIFQGALEQQDKEVAWWFIYSISEATVSVSQEAKFYIDLL